MLAAPPFNFLESIGKVDCMIDVNAEIARKIVESVKESFIDLDWDLKDWKDQATSRDFEKARATITQFYRDWSAEGANERKACNDPVIEVIQKEFLRAEQKRDVKVLVPGAGLGRLVFEICRLGYTVEGNELSYHQIMASSWVLNHAEPHTQYELYPWALNFSNLARRRDQLTCVKIPDIHPAIALNGRNQDESVDRMSMTAGDFTTLYWDEKYMSVFDVVATVFFVDTAPNVIKYIETVHNCLKDGGIWVNLGPLLWHFAERSPPTSPNPNENEKSDQKPKKWGIEAPGSFELTNEEVLLLVERLGFEIEMHEIREDGEGYIQDPESLMQHSYKCSFWIARKKPGSSSKALGVYGS